MIIRGTTPKMSFGLPFETSAVAIGFVVIRQGKVPVVEKEFTKCKCNGNTVTAEFTQEDTLSLSADKKAEINLVVRLLNGERHESFSIFESVEDTSKEGII